MAKFGVDVRFLKQSVDPFEDLSISSNVIRDIFFLQTVRVNKIEDMGGTPGVVTKKINIDLDEAFLLLFGKN